MILDSAMSASASGLIPWNSAGYSIAPTPMIAPWPAVRRGTQGLAPLVARAGGRPRRRVVGAYFARVGRADRGGGEVVQRELARAGPPDDVLVAAPELGEVHGLGALDVGDDERAGAVGLGQVDREAEVDVLWLHEGRLAVDLGEGIVHV